MRLLIIDDHTLFREGLSLLIERDNPNSQIFGVSSLSEAQEIAQTNKLDFVLLDLKLEEMQASQVAALAIPIFPDTPVIILSGRPEVNLIRGAIEAGAMGFIPKSLSFADFSAALTRSLSGEVYLPQLTISENFNDPETPSVDAESVGEAVAQLTPRQLEILRLLVYGFSNKSIGKQLNMSDGTVKTHMVKIFSTLDIHSRAEAVYLLSQVELSALRKNSNTSNSSWINQCDETISD